MSRKVSISNRIIMSGLTREEMEAIASQVNYKITVRIGSRVVVTYINNFSKINISSCSIPSGRLDLIPTDIKDISDNTNSEKIDFPEFYGTLRNSQQEVYNDVNSSCMINAPVSWGKTFTALAIVKKLSRKTLIITHTTMLRDQWVSKIEELFKITPGIVKNGKIDGLDKPIIVGNIQSIIKIIPSVSKLFGTVILDECHHVPATTFSLVLDKLNSKYKIGLSGTLKRKDGKHVVFKDYFGDIIFKPEKENCMQPSIIRIDSGFILNPSTYWANRINDLELLNPDYKKFVIGLTEKMIDRGHKVLVVASRVNFLEFCASKVKGAISITGSTPQNQREALLSSLNHNKIHAIFGTLSIFSEGISQDNLSCLILATPINNESLLEQLIGRIIRVKENKKTPIVLDILLKGPSTDKQAKNRLGVYLKSGYEVKNLKI